MKTIYVKSRIYRTISLDGFPTKHIFTLKSVKDCEGENRIILVKETIMLVDRDNDIDPYVLLKTFKGKHLIRIVQTFKVETVDAMLNAAVDMLREFNQKAQEEIK